MKTATIAQRGRNHAGVDMVRVRCPVCDGSHWLRADEPVVRCPRRGARGPAYRIEVKR